MRFLCLISLLVVAQSFLSVAAATAVLRWRYDGVILSGVKVAGIDVGGLDTRQALAALRAGLPQPSPDSKLLLATPEGQTWSIPYGNLRWTYDYEGAIAEAQQVGKELKNLKQLESFFRLMLSGVNIPVRPCFAEDNLREFLEGIAPSCYLEPKPAQLAFDQAEITILPESNGRELDIEGSIYLVRNLEPRQHRVVLAFKPITPELTADKLKTVNARIGYFITAFNPLDKDRTRNVVLAASLLNNVVVPPGDEFSLNERLGPRVPERGFQKAILLTANGLKHDYGGGVCQVASTLYNAVLGAGLPVTQRTPHLRPVPYVPPGRDATIYKDVIDFRFRNDRAEPIVILAEVQDDKLHVGIFGHEENAGNIVYKTEVERTLLKAKTIYRIDPVLTSGKIRVADPGRDGYVITTYEVKYINNRIVHRYPIALQQVNPRPALVYVAEADRPRYTIDK
ncbi:VanW family protein [Desulforudis sp. 1088]|uniref:VanW family protein n=1 Tax=unclassified Candidatus Desulforudis TaxID=2635950 RepID=UPI003CE5B374